MKFLKFDLSPVGWFPKWWRMWRVKREHVHEDFCAGLCCVRVKENRNRIWIRKSWRDSERSVERSIFIELTHSFSQLLQFSSSPFLQSHFKFIMYSPKRLYITLFSFHFTVCFILCTIYNAYSFWDKYLRFTVYIICLCPLAAFFSHAFPFENFRRNHFKFRQKNEFFSTFSFLRYAHFFYSFCRLFGVWSLEVTAHADFSAYGFCFFTYSLVSSIMDLWRGYRI